MDSSHIPPPPGPDIPTQPHPSPLPDDPLKGPVRPPDIEQPQPVTPENPAQPRPVHPPAESPAPTAPPTWD